MRQAELYVDSTLYLRININKVIVPLSFLIDVLLTTETSWYSVKVTDFIRLTQLRHIIPFILIKEFIAEILIPRQSFQILFME